MLKRYFLILILLLACKFVGAETLRLNSGETLKGRIRAMDEQTLYLDSNLTSQQLRVDRADIRLIEFESSERSMTRRLGIGLFYRPQGSTEELLLKNWISPTDAIELLIAYKEGDRDLFNFEVRFNRVFLREGQYDLYYGAGAGLTSVSTTRGTRLRIFSGSELFPVTNPNIGLGIEIGILRESNTASTGFDKSNDSVTEQTFYNAVTARYYF